MMEYPVTTEVSDSTATEEVAPVEETTPAEEAPAVVEEAEQEGFHKVLKTNARQNTEKTSMYHLHNGKCIGKMHFVPFQ